MGGLVGMSCAFVSLLPCCPIVFLESVPERSHLSIGRLWVLFLALQELLFLSHSLHSWTHPYLYKRKTTMPYEKFKFRIQSHQDYSWCFRKHTCGELCWIIERLDWQRFCSVWVSTSRWGHRHHLHHRLDPFSGSKLVSHFYMTVYVLQCSYMLLAWKL